MDLELDPVRQSGGGGKPGQPHRILGITSAARIWQKEKTLRIDKIENIRERVVPPGKIGTAQRYGYDLGAARDESVAHGLVGRELSRADEQSRSKFAIRNL